MAEIHVTQRLKALRERAGLSMLAVAREMGYRTPSGYQRYEDAALYKDNALPLKIVRKLVPILTGKGMPEILQIEVLALAGNDGLVVSRTDTDTMPVTGRVAAGLWSEIDDLDQEPLGQIPIAADTRHPGRRQYALKVEGDSMNKVVPSGSFIVVIEAFGQEPRDGDLVIVRQHRRGLVERTLKRVRRVNSHFELHPESTESKFKPLIIDGDEDTHVEIEAYAIGTYRPL